ncbi:Sugar phosphatase YidA [Paenibacillus konkukensis]|uniref:Sugar phosphatase YidA n=1 Tax=Paenibacillus konkukensis TaxID=2020716 RepID=A0ABY4RL90_9BACL|nr:Cof-type HAD-IIB family hydrolase [Paenibacillus konkukensis]UQZ83266.1 Sugar phosphatase YidA [Paenibacillus konkukensis]
MYRLLILDMDGTLLNRSKIVTPAVRLSLETLIGKGVKVTIASGRFPASVWLHGQHIGMNCPLIALNGAVILDAATGRCLHGYPLRPDAALHAAKLAAEAGVYIHFYGYNRLYVEALNAMNAVWPLANVVRREDAALTWDNYRSQAELIEVQPVGSLAKFAETAEAPLYKATVISDRADALNSLYDELRSGGEFVLTRTGTRRFDINASGVSKRSAAELICRMQGIIAEETAAIGDYDNDVEMLSWAGLGIAMANGSEAAKQAAAALTAGNEEDGVALAVEKYFTI